MQRFYRFFPLFLLSLVIITSGSSPTRAAIAAQLTGPSATKSID